ncbi:hypothetical protein II810_04450 [bacterium]|nr:hypothetical protein [bacterium]
MVFKRWKMRLIRFFIVFALLFMSAQNSFCANVWVNDARKLFLQNGAIIYEINIRTFGAQDKNKDGIIDLTTEESGNFINAIPKLNILAQKGVNTIHVLPITPVGKTKALGTAGSLYSVSSFNTINPQLANKKVNMPIKNQAIKFINEAHSKGLRVILDLPSCASYDLYLKRPELFVKDKSGEPVIPADWTDVRLLNGGDEQTVNSDVYSAYKSFVDMAIELGADGIRADVAPIKPAKFWEDLIKYSRTKDPQFLWLAEAYDNQDKISDYAPLTTSDKLLEAGFDGYYGSFASFKDMKTAKEFTDLVVNTNAKLAKYPDKKSAIGSFTTHDEMSPILVNGAKLSEMMMWLNATLPFNSYSTDGFDTGDNYIYMWANKKALKTYTDDDIYFVHRGKVDIFNFSRAPGGNDTNLSDNFVFANNFKSKNFQIIQSGVFTPLKTSKPSVFAYTMSYKDTAVIVIGNLDFRAETDVKVTVPKLSSKDSIVPIKIESIPLIKKGTIETTLKAGEIIVLLLND